jgi:6-pyruvoyltetrahydropterin/6-carboxytetrahydropterin synthase
MYYVSVRRHFDAAHGLRGYNGKCEKFHGHRFEVVARVAASQLDRLGMAYDFRALKKDLEPIIDRLDHTNLNETPPFDEINPSSENIARFIYDELKKSLKVRLESVEVWESPDAWATYEEG